MTTSSAMEIALWDLGFLPIPNSMSFASSSNPSALMIASALNGLERRISFCKSSNSPFFADVQSATQDLAPELTPAAIFSTHSGRFAFAANNKSPLSKTDGSDKLRKARRQSQWLARLAFWIAVSPKLLAISRSRQAFA